MGFVCAFWGWGWPCDLGTRLPLALLEDGGGWPSWLRGQRGGSRKKTSFLVFSEQNEAQSWHASIWLQQSSSEPVSSPPSKVPCERAAGLWRTGQKVTRPPLPPIHLQFCPPPHPSLSTQALPSPGLLGISLWSFRIRQPAHPGPQQPEQTHTGVLPFPLIPQELPRDWHSGQVRWLTSFQKPA